MSQIRFKYDNECDNEKDVEIITIRCSNCGKQTGLSLDNMNVNYKDKVTVFVLNTLLHHVGMSWIIETHKRLKYDIYQRNQDWTTGGPWYNTSICQKIHGIVFEEFIRNEITDRYNLMCYIDEHEKQ